MLGEQFRDNAAVNIGEAEISALEAIDQFFVIKAEQVEKRRLEVVDMNGIFGDGKAEFISLAVGDAPLRATARHEHRVAIREMIPAENLAVGGAAFPERSPAKLATPDHQRFIEQPPLFKITNERRDGTVHRGALVRQSIRQPGIGGSSMEIPAPVEELDEADPLLHETPGEQAIIGERSGARLRAVILEDVLGFLGNIHHLGHGGLHAKGEFILGDAG